MILRIVLFISLLSSVALAQLESGVNLMTYHSVGYTVDPKTEQGVRVRRLLQRIRDLKISTVIFNFRAHQRTAFSDEVFSTVPPELWPQEEQALSETVRYAQSLGLQVAFRPILLVIGPNGEFPYQENGKYWWHGVIRPPHPQLWFDSYFRYHSRYMRLAASLGVRWQSIGAEMHSMTSGLGSRDRTARLGYPDLWLSFIAKARQIVGNQVQLTYGINFTDQYVLEDGNRTWGGEFEQWRYFLTAPMRSSQDSQHQAKMREFWRALDFIGIDFYRALGNENTTYPSDYTKLSEMLSEVMGYHEYQLNNSMSEINRVTTSNKKLAIQEVGYRSVERSFVNPYLYEDADGHINYMHQAAAWNAFLNILWRPSLSWFYGVGIWQVLVDDDSDTMVNGGFSPLGKAQTEDVLKNYFGTAFREGPSPRTPEKAAEPAQEGEPTRREKAPPKFP